MLVLNVDLVDGDEIEFCYKDGNFFITDGYQTDYFNSRFELESNQVAMSDTILKRVKAFKKLKEDISFISDKVILEILEYWVSSGTNDAICSMTKDLIELRKEITISLNDNNFFAIYNALSRVQANIRYYDNPSKFGTYNASLDEIKMRAWNLRNMEGK